MLSNGFSIHTLNTSRIITANFVTCRVHWQIPLCSFLLEVLPWPLHKAGNFDILERGMYFTHGERERNIFYLGFPMNSHMGKTSEIRYFVSLGFDTNVKKNCKK